MTQAGNRVQTGPVLSQTPSPKGGALAQTAMSLGTVCQALGGVGCQRTPAGAGAAAPVQGSLWGDSCLSLLLFLEPTARPGSSETQGPSESLAGDRHLLGEPAGARVPSGPQPEPAFLGPWYFGAFFGTHMSLEAVQGSACPETQASPCLPAAADTPGTPTGQRCSPLGLLRRTAQAAGTQAGPGQRPGVNANPHYQGAGGSVPPTGLHHPNPPKVKERSAGPALCWCHPGKRSSERRRPRTDRRPTGVLDGTEAWRQQLYLPCACVPMARGRSGVGAEQPSLGMPTNSEPHPAPWAGGGRALVPLEEPGLSSQGQVGCTSTLTHFF